MKKVPQIWLDSETDSLRMHALRLRVEKWRTRARSSLFWPGINGAIDEMASQCSRCLKGEVSRKFDVISKPKNVCLTTETKKLVARFVINYHSSAKNCRLVPLARDRVGCNGLKLEKYWAIVFQFLVILFSKCARTNHESFLSRMELIFLLSLF